MVTFDDLECGQIVEYRGDSWEIGFSATADKRYGRILEMPTISTNKLIVTRDCFIMMRNLQDDMLDWIHIDNIIKVLSDAESMIHMLEC